MSEAINPIREEYTPPKEISSKGFIIAIDGPARVGKGTTSELLREKLGTDAVVFSASPFYRAVGYYCKEHPEFDSSDPNSVEEMMGKIQLGYENGQVILNGEPLEDGALRSNEVDKITPKVARHMVVHDQLIKLRRSIVSDLVNTGRTVIVEGRNEGSAAFPDADAKIFLDANEHMRTRRDILAKVDKGVQGVQAREIHQDLVSRDESDRQRDTFPLVTDPEKSGYEIVDNSLLNPAETVDAIMDILKKKGLIDKITNKDEEINKVFPET